MLHDYYINKSHYLMQKSALTESPTSWIYSVLLLSVFLIHSAVKESTPIIAALVTGLLVFFIYESSRSRLPGLRWSNSPLWFATTSLLFLFFAGQFFWEYNTHSFVVIAPFFILLLLTPTSKNIIETTLLVFLFLIVLIAGFEKFTGTYLFVSHASRAASDGTEGVLLDEQLFAGAAGILRAKSIFLGPLTLSIFLVGSAIILRQRRLAILLCLVGAFLAVSRSGIFLIGIIAIWSFAVKKGIPLKERTLFAATVGSALSVILLTTPEIIDRIMDALDFSGNSSTNNARLYYWSTAISEISQYDFTQLIIGENGLYRSLYNNNAESGWLTLILDFGFLGFSLYALPLLFIFLKTQSNEIRFFISLLFLANSTSTFCYGVTGCFVYWLSVYSFYTGSKRNESCYSS